MKCEWFLHALSELQLRKGIFYFTALVLQHRAALIYWRRVVVRNNTVMVKVENIFINSDACGIYFPDKV